MWSMAFSMSECLSVWLFQTLQIFCTCCLQPWLESFYLSFILTISIRRLLNPYCLSSFIPLTCSVCLHGPLDFPHMFSTVLLVYIHLLQLLNKVLIKDWSTQTGHILNRICLEIIILNSLIIFPAVYFCWYVMWTSVVTTVTCFAAQAFVAVCSFVSLYLLFVWLLGTQRRSLKWTTVIWRCWFTLMAGTSVMMNGSRWTATSWSLLRKLIAWRRRFLTQNRYLLLYSYII